MRENLTIARPYAFAAFGFAVAADDSRAWSTMLESLATVTSHAEFKPLINHPRISKSQLFELLEEILGTQLNDKRANFLNALLDSGRLGLAPEIATLFERHKAAAQGVVEVQVESAYEISASEQDKIAVAVQARLGKDCKVSAEINRDLIGGAVIRVGDSVIDISLRGRLRALEQRLA